MNSASLLVKLSLFTITAWIFGIDSSKAQSELPIYELSPEQKVEMANRAHIPDSLIEPFFVYLRPLIKADVGEFIQKQSTGAISRAAIPLSIEGYLKKYEERFPRFLKNRDTVAYFYQLTHQVKKSILQEELSIAKKQPVILNAACNNVDFELGDLNGWTGTYCPATNELQGPPINFSCYGVRSCYPFPAISPTNPYYKAGIVQGPNNNQSNYDAAAPNLMDHHSLMTTGAGNDQFLSSLWGINVPRVWPGGGNTSLRLGNDSADNSGESISYTFNVTSANNIFTYHYAVVLYDGGHLPAIEPYFKVRMCDQNGDTIQCASFNVDASPADAAAAGLVNETGITLNGTIVSIWYNNWKTITVPLTSYIGQNVTVTFTTSDCGLNTAVTLPQPCNPPNYSVVYEDGGHFAYAYVDAECGSFIATYIPQKCPTDSVFLSAPGGFMNYRWSGPGVIGSPDRQNITVNKGGAYHLGMAIIGETNCTAEIDTVMNIQLLPLITAVPGSTPVSCTLATGSVWVSPATGGTPGYSYQWSNGASGTTLTNVGGGVYTVTVTDAKSCTLTNAFNFNQPVPLSITGSTLPAVCNNACNGQASVFAFHGALPYSVLWSNNETDTVITGLCAGTYKVTITDFNNCRKDTILTVNQPPAIVSASSVTPALCFQGTGSASVQASGGAGGVGGYTYTWSGGSSSATSDSLLAATYTVTVADENNCTSTTVAVVTQPAELVLNTPGSSNVCIVQGQSTTLAVNPSGGTPAYTIAWMPGGLTGPSVTVLPQASMIYTVLATDANGCTAAPEAITVGFNPIADFKSDTSVGCPVLCISFTDLSSVVGGSINKWFWNFGDGNTDTLENPQACYSTSGTYSVYLSVTTNIGCTATDTISNMILVYPKPHAAFSTNPNTAFLTTLYPQLYYVNQSTGAISWLWNFGDSSGSDTSDLENPVHTFASTPESYCTRLYVKNTQGCEDTSTLCFDVRQPFAFYVPDAFTPNGDNLNETFNGKGVGISSYEMTVFDRWGNLIFTTHDLNEGWNGKANGGVDIAQQDVYVYSIVLTDEFNVVHNYVGHVTLIR